MTKYGRPLSSFWCPKSVGYFRPQCFSRFYNACWNTIGVFDCSLKVFYSKKWRDSNEKKETDKNDDSHTHSVIVFLLEKFNWRIVVISTRRWFTCFICFFIFAIFLQTFWNVKNISFSPLLSWRTSPLRFSKMSVHAS